jgi:hypothetical protein
MSRTGAVRRPVVYWRPELSMYILPVPLLTRTFHHIDHAKSIILLATFRRVENPSEPVAAGQADNVAAGQADNQVAKIK